MKYFIQNKLSIILLISASMLISVIVFLYLIMQKVKTTDNIIVQTQEMLYNNNIILMDVVNVEASMNDYIISGNEIFLEPFNKAFNIIYSDIAILEKLSDAEQMQLTKLVLMKNSIDKQVFFAKNEIDNINTNGLNQFETIQKSKILFTQIKNIISDINYEGFSLLSQRKIENEKNNKILELVFIFLLIYFFIVVILIYFILKNYRIKKIESKEIDYSISLVEASFNPLVSINSNGKIKDINLAFANITGLTREQLIDTDFFDYLIEPQLAREVYKKVFANNSIADFSFTIRNTNGKLTDVLFNGSVFKNEKGSMWGVLIVAREIVEQIWASDIELSENKIINLNEEKENIFPEIKITNYARKLIEASRDPLFTINLEGKITDMNNASIEITGVSREKLLGTDFFNYFTDPQKAQEVYLDIFSEGYVVDFPLTIRDGVLTDVLFNGSVFKDDKGDVMGVVVVARDITEKKKIEKELIEAKLFAELATLIAEDAKIKAESAAILAEDSVKAKQQFLSNMSHEIRTPMNAIIGFTKVLLKTELSSKQTEYLTAIKLSGDSLIVLINDILDLAKVEAGKMIFEQIPFKMELSISAMLHIFESKIQEKNLILIKDYDSSIPDVLLGDPLRLHQIILNLLSNAVKFTSKGTITVKVSLLKEDENQVSIEFVVTDTGIGIPKNKIEKIFENFQQATSGTSRLYGGTGLGLAIVKQLVESQGGTINVISIEKKGATFSFILPFQKTDVKAEIETDIMEIDETNKNIKVLVAEDIPLNQLLMKTLLDDFGFEREIASNGKIAIEKLSEKAFDIILMDLQMPEMNGFEATEYIRKTMKNNIPIIALTADVTTVDLAKCKTAGMNDYIAKPVDERLLYSKIISLVKKPIHVDYDIENVENKNIKSKCIDLEYLMQRTKSNPKLMMEMIALYLEQTPPLILAMKQGFQDKNWPLLHTSVHKMIPSFSIMGLDTDYENMARKLQEYAITQLQNDGALDLILQLEKICTQACEELTVEFNLIKINN